MGDSADGSRDKPRLAISNVERQTLTGPHFLDRIVKFLEDEIAIDHIDARFLNQRITYKSLKSLAALLAREVVKSLGEKKEQTTIVPVIIPQQPALYVSYLAILGVGAAFCPITPETPDERIRFIIDDVHASLVLCLPEMVERFRTILPHIECLAVDFPALMKTFEERAETTHIEKSIKPGRTPNDTAYVMYTSGSTGKPKGVLISHHAITQSLLAHDEHIPCFKRFLQFAAPTFDVSIFEIFFTWLRGSTLVSCDRESMLLDLPNIINSQNIDAVELTPTVVTTLIRTRSTVPHVKVILTIGEMLTSNIVREFGATDTTEGLLYAMYGPTEAAVHCTIVPKMQASDKPSNIGRPLSTVTALILRETSASSQPQIMTANEVGELAIAGQLADGYLNRPDQTSAAFINVPGFGPVYRTGDRAFVADSGHIYMLGRISAGQVKVRGQRVELGEIEEAVYQLDGMNLAVAMLIEEQIVLFCSGRPSLTVNTVEDRCKAWLPRHMRPSHVILTDGILPRLDSGKVDRKALQKMFEELPKSRRVDHANPVSSTESFLLQTFEAELGTTISMNTSLRTYGLDSLRAIRVASRLRPQFHAVSLPLILEADSIADLANDLDNAQLESLSTSDIQDFDDTTQWQKMKQFIQDENSHYLENMYFEDLHPCSAMQTAMLSETLRDPALNYNEIQLSYDSSFSFDAIVKAFQTVAQKNPILRGGFINTDEVDMPFVQVTRKSLDWQGSANLIEPFKLSKGDGEGTVVVQIHHALYDGWSWDLIVLDVNTFLLGTTPPDRPQFTEFRKLKQRQAVLHAERDLTVWVNYLQDVSTSALPVLNSNLPKHRDRKQAFTTLSTGLDAYQRAAKMLHVNTAAIIHSAVSLILSAYLDTTSVVTGMVNAGRDLLPSVEDVIGPCLSMLPVVVRLDQVARVSELIRHVYAQHIHTLRHTNVSLAQIQSALTRHENYSLFDFVFVWQESLVPRSKDHMPIRTVSTYDNLDYALVFEVEPDNGHLTMKTTFDRRRWPREQVVLFHRQIDSCISFMVQNFEAILADLYSHLPNTVLSISNAKCSSPELEDLTYMIARQAQQNPAKIAIDFVEDFDPVNLSASRKTLSYGELYSMSQALSWRLQEHYHVSKGDIIAVCAPKSINTYALICGIVSAGCAYLCIDQNTPKARANEVLGEVRCKLVISTVFQQEDVAESLVLTYDDVFFDLESSKQAFCSQSHACTSDLAYAVFTSGSTGVPKGVLITRENLMTNLHHLKKVYPYNSASRLLQSCSLAFDVSVFEIFWTWYCGMTLCSATNDVLFQDLEAFIDAQNITHLSMTPSVAALVNPHRVPTVEFLVCAGEPMSAKVFEAWADHGLHQGYGPSETTNICNVRNYAHDKAPINVVGQAFPSTSLFVCHRLPKGGLSRSLTQSDFRPVPCGGVGEVWIGGAQVGRGYTSQFLTSRSWCDHSEFGKLYRSGDIGRLLADGSLMILGREDDQTKIRGHRIDLAEISLRLIQSEYVSDSIVMLVKDSAGNDRLVAFCVLEELGMKEEKDVIMASFQKLQNVLPSYMIPELLLPIPLIPLTKQGKVDRRELQTRYSAMTDIQRSEYTAHATEGSQTEPWTGEELAVAHVVSAISKVPITSINLHASLFTYGIDSIAAITLSRRLRQNRIVDVDASSIMSQSSIKRILSSRRENGHPLHTFSSKHKADEIVPESIKQRVKTMLQQHGTAVQHVLPCTSVQQAILASAGESQSRSYLNHIVYRFSLNAQMMKDAWERLAERHEILRTTFVLTDHADFSYVQAVLPAAKLPWLTLEQSDAELFIPTSGQLFYQIQITPNHTQSSDMHLFMHHALYDGEAMNHVQDEIESICGGRQLPPPVSFSRYLEFGIEPHSSVRQKYWHRILRSVVPSRVGQVFKFEKPSIKRSCRAQKLLRIPLSQIQSVATGVASTILALLQTTLTSLLSRYLQTSDICFGTVFSGRNLPIPGIEHIVGPCFNTLPTRARLRHNTTSTDLIRFFQNFNIESLPFQASSIRQLQKEYSPDGRPLYDFLLLLQSPVRTLDEGIWQIIHEEGQIDFPFVLEVVPDIRNDEIQLSLHSTVSHEEHLRIILKDFVDVFDRVMASPHSLARSSDLMLGGLSCLPKQDLILESRESVPVQMASPPKSDRDTIVMQMVVDSINQLTRNNTSDLDRELSIFRLGFDSISVVQLASGLRSRGFQILAADILENPRISEIAKFCANNLEKDNPESDHVFELEAFDLQHRSHILNLLGCASTELQAIWPCTSTQVGIISEHLQAGGKVYFNEIKLRLQDGVDVSKLRSAFQQAMERHVMLRTGFVEVEDSESPYAMVIYSTKTAKLPWISPAESESRRSSGVSNARDLASPPWQIEISGCKDQIYLVLRLLHALYDAQSLDIILSDVVAAYHDRKPLDIPKMEEAVGTIVSQNRVSVSTSKVVDILHSNAESTIFPDLNIVRNAPCELMVSKLEMSITTQAMHEACKNLDVTLWIACQTAWARLLAAYCGQSRVTFGAVLAGRDFRDHSLNRVAFPCMNTVPASYDTSLSGPELVASVKQYTAELLKTQHVSLPRIKAALDLDREFFDSLLVLQNFKWHSDEGAPWIIESDQASAEYKLSLEVLPDQYRTNLQLTYNASHIPPEHGPILLHQFEEALCQTLRMKSHKSDTDPTLIAVLPPKQLRIPSTFTNLHQMIMSSATLHPTRIALRFVTSIDGETNDSKAWTYAELVANASRVADLLLHHGAVSGDMVAICFEKCPEASFALLGVLMAGCAYVAIDPSMPIFRKNFIIKDSKTRIVLTSSATAALLETMESIQTLVLDAAALTGSEDSHSRQMPPSNFDSTCYCLYTSGTTGEPKGCLISHDSAVQAMLSFSRIFQGRWTSESKWLQFAAYHFDVSVLEHFWTWSEGLCVTVVPRDLLFEDLPRAITNLGITHLDLTPSLARLLTPENAPTLCNGVFVVGGEQVGQDIVETWGNAGCLYNFYGPSEVTIGCTVRPRVQGNVKPSNIGQQWDNVGSYILDPLSEQPVLVGAVGELCLSGPLVGKGYLNRPDLTAKKFVILQSTSDRVYRTGDLVRMLHDHSFEFLGRIDDQIKLRGQRLEVGEINHVLHQNSNNITDVATLVLTHPEQSREHLVSFLARTRRTTTELSKPQMLDNDSTHRVNAAMRKQATTHLPAYMVPTYFIAIDFLPLTVNNKVDSKALRSLYQIISLDSVRTQQSPQYSTSDVSEAESDRLVEAIVNHLKLEKKDISSHSSLFQLGMDSIRAISLARNLKAAGYTTASVTQIMKHPVISDLAGALSKHSDIDSTSARSTASSLIQIEKFSKKHLSSLQQSWKAYGKTVKRIYPCTPLQEGMISRLLKSSTALPHYLVKFIYRLHSNVDASRLATAWHNLELKLDILRTYFMATHDGYAQVILSENEEAVSIYSMDAPDAHRPVKLINEQFQQWSQQVCNLERALPWKIGLFESNTGEQNYMALFMFHGLYDGNSLSLLLDALFGEYSSCRLHNDQIPQFFDALSYGPLLRLEDAPTFWRRHLSQAQLLGLSHRKGNGATKDTCISHRHLESIKVSKISSHLGVTPQAVLCALWLYCLAQEFGVNPAIGVVLSGRSIDLHNAENIVGPMFNTVPFTIHESRGRISLIELVKICHDKIVNIMPYQHSSLRDIKKWTGISPENEPFDSIFVYQDSRHLAQSQKDWPWVQYPADNIIDYPLNIEIERSTDKNFSITIAMPACLEYRDTPLVLMDSLMQILDETQSVYDILLPDCFNSSQSDEYSRDGKNQEATTSNETSASDWTVEATLIRDELATLAQVRESTINFDKPTIFELGLDSIDALKLAARLKTKGIQIPVSKILQFPSIRGMIEQCTSFQKQRPKQMSLIKDYQSLHSQDIPGIDNNQMDTIQAFLPVTPLQEGMLLYFEQYFYTLAYKLCYRTDVRRLVAAINEAMKDLPILRTQFRVLDADGDGPKFLQVVERSSTQLRHSCESLELSDISSLKHYLHTKKKTATILTSMPNVARVTLKDGVSYLIFALPHASYDAWSLNLLHNHIHQSYYGKQPAAQDVSVTAEYVYEVREAGTSQAAFDFWSSQVKSAQPTTIPRSRHRNAVATVRSVTSEGSLKDAQSTCKKYSISMQSLGLAVWSLSLMMMVRQLDITFGVVMSGRTSEETQQLVFPTFNTVLFRPNIDESVEKEELLRRIHQLSVQIFEHQNLPLTKSLQLAGKRDEDLFNSLFTFQKAPINQSRDDLLYEEVDLGMNTVSPPYAVNVELEERDNQLFWTVAVQAGFLTSDELHSILESLDSTLQYLIHADNTIIFKVVGNRVSICEHKPIKMAKQSNIEQNSKNRVHIIPAITGGECADLEYQVREVFSEVSNIEVSDVAHHMTLFNLGLDSISAIKLSNLLRRKGIRLAVSQILTGQRIHDIALLASKEPGSWDSSGVDKNLVKDENKDWRKLLSALDVDCNDVENVLPATGGQTHTLDMWHASEKKLFYPCFWLRINNCDVSRFQGAWVELVDKMSALRTKFCYVDSEYYQVIYKADIPAQHSFAWRLEVAQAGGDLLVAVQLHHAIYDAVSFAHMISGLDDLLKHEPAVFQNQTSFKAFINETSGERISARKFWTEYLNDSIHLNYRGKGSFEADRVSAFKTRILSLHNLGKIARREDLTLQAIFFAIIGRIVARTGQGRGVTPTAQHIDIGIWLANRSLDIDGLADLRYPTFNIVPLRVDIGSGILEASRRVQLDLQNISQAENCGISLRDIYAWTECRLDCFVNFLRLPDVESTVSRISDISEHQSIVRHAEGDDKERAQALLNDEARDASSPMVGDVVLEGNLDWCLPALDIEAKVDEDGYLAVGLFAPEDLIAEAELWEMMDEVRKSLEGIERL